MIIDEIDSLVGDTLISVLRQIRSGYPRRPKQFPQSIILCGVRDVRDYRIHSSQNKEIITGGSAFNIKAKSLRLGDFTPEESDALLDQHTLETGQAFTPEARACIRHLTQEQPWLINALAYETCFEMKEGRVRTTPINKEMVDQAKENLIIRRETHLDQLADKLGEDRVRRVIDPMLRGLELDIRRDDIEYVLDLPGAPRGRRPGYGHCHPIYGEIIPRELTYAEEYNLVGYDTPWYVNPDGVLDMKKLLTSFQDFFRENSEHWLQRFEYREAGPKTDTWLFLTGKKKA